MIFNSFAFIIFFIVFYAFFITFKKHRGIFVLISSYFFYGYWEATYLLLIILSTIIDYFIAIKIEKVNSYSRKKLFLFASIFSNFSILFFFKYHNFFVRDILNHQDLVHSFLLPVGISFYTFQTVSYTIDVFYGEIKAEKNFLRFALYVSYWPQLVAGPIERASRLLPQLSFKNQLTKDDLSYSLSKIIFGFFKKVVIADKAAIIVNHYYTNPSSSSSFELLLATIFFAVQIYCDFSGYSDIALGTARLMGVKLMENFNSPYFAINIRDFWRQWHISLSTWFRDYFYKPIGGRSENKPKWKFNLFLTFLVSGVWHGANWTYIAWGALHGLGIVIYYSFVSLKLNINKYFAWFSTIVFVLITWVFFRANNVTDAVGIIKNIFEFNFNYDFYEKHRAKEVITFSFFLFFMEAIFYFDLFSKIRCFFEKNKKILLSTLVFLILMFGEFSEKGKFIYFQF